jgi:hypothetical protein
VKVPGVNSGGARKFHRACEALPGSAWLGWSHPQRVTAAWATNETSGKIGHVRGCPAAETPCWPSKALLQRVVDAQARFTSELPGAGGRTRRRGLSGNAGRPPELAGRLDGCPPVALDSKSIRRTGRPWQLPRSSGSCLIGRGRSIEKALPSPLGMPAALNRLLYERVREHGRPPQTSSAVTMSQADGK